MAYDTKLMNAYAELKGIPRLKDAAGINDPKKQAELLTAVRDLKTSVRIGSAGISQKLDQVVALAEKATAPRSWRFEISRAPLDGHIIEVRAICEPNS